MPQTKSILQSVTFWGSVVSLLALFQPKLFLALGAQPSDVAVYIQAAVGFGITAWGRLRATQPVTITGTPKNPSTVTQIPVASSKDVPRENLP